MTETANNGTIPVCINCGFVGAARMVDGFGPYCGKCAAQAAGAVPPAPYIPPVPYPAPRESPIWDDGMVCKTICGSSNRW